MELHKSVLGSSKYHNYHNILKLNISCDPNVRTFFEGKTWYSMIKNGNILIIIKAPPAVWVPCYTEPLSKIRLWIRISLAITEQEQFVEAVKLCKDLIKIVDEFLSPIIPILITWNEYSDGIAANTG